MRKVDRKDGSTVPRRLAAAHRDSSLVALDDLTADPKSESGSRRAFRGVEGLEDFARGCVRHSGAGIRDDDPDSKAVGNGIVGAVDADSQSAP